MIETRYKDPYVLNCGHTFEKDKADSLLSCEKCGTEVISRAPNFALKNLVSDISNLVAISPTIQDWTSTKLQPEIGEFSEIEEHRSECSINMSTHHVTNEELLKVGIETNKILNFIWGNGFISTERRIYRENILKKRISDYYSHEEVERDEMTSQPHDIYRQYSCIIL